MSKARQTAKSTLLPDTAPWTASRCLRILRRLESRLASLRKLGDLPSLDVQKVPDVVTTQRSAKRSSGDYSDIDNGHQRKRSRITYGGRNKKQRTTSTRQQRHQTPPRPVRTLRAMKARSSSILRDRPGHPSPMCTRILGHQVEFCTEAYQIRKLPDPAAGQQHQQLQGHLEKSRIHTDVLTWLQSLLHSTQIYDGEPHKKSLFAMCLRRIPACIADIEAWDKARAQDQAPSSVHQTSEASREIYSQLEEFGAAGLGWRPLKHTLRAHGLWTLKKAIEEGLFSGPQTAQLVRMCIQFGCIDEATHLATITNGNLPWPQAAGSFLDEHATLEPIHALLAAARGKENAHLGSVFGGVSRLIKEKHLPVSWLSTQGLSFLLAAAIQVIGAEDGCCTMAIDFLTTTVKALCGDRDRTTWHDPDTRLRTLTRIAAGLVTHAGRTPSTEARASFTLGCCINEVRSQKRLLKEQVLFVLKIARFLAQGKGVPNVELCGYEAEHGFEDSDTEADGNPMMLPAHFRQVLDLVCFVAQRSSQQNLAPAHVSFMEICQRLERLPWPRWFVTGLRKDGAFVLAEKTNDLRDLAFAEGQVLHNQTRRSDQAKTWFSNCYWEDAIGEFVLCSPEKRVDNSSRGVEQARMWSQTRHRPRQAPWARQSPHVIGQAAEEEVPISGRDSGMDLDIRTTQCGVVKDSEKFDSISESPQEGAVITTPADDEDTGIGRMSRVYASSSRPETRTRSGQACRGHMQGKQEKKHRRQMSGNGLRLGFESPAPIGGARQLFIVRGPGRKSAGDDDDWMEW